MKKYIVSILCTCLLTLFGWYGYIYKCAFENIQNTVVIECKIDTMFGETNSIGTGVIIDANGVILTAKHVIEDSIKSRVQLYNGQVCAIDRYVVDVNSDLALLYLKDVNTGSQVEVNAGLVNVTARVIYGIGTAYGFLNNHISFGYVKNTRLKRFVFNDSHMLLMKMAIYPGCSGGGVYHYKKLIGIMVAKKHGYSFAVGNKEIIRFLQENNLKDLTND